MYSSIPQRPSHLRVFVGCLLSFLMLIAPIASVGAATRRATTPTPKKQLTANEKLETTLFEPALPAPPVPAVTATKTDSFPDLDADGKAQPGEQITYTVNITNSGTDATNATFNDTIDPNTTLVPGSLKVSPVAAADTYAADQNVTLNVAAPGVLTNDFGTPAPTAVPIAAGPTTAGGTVTLNADGSFTYNPPSAVFTGADTFTYTATNLAAGGLSPDDTATVTITVDSPPAVSSTTPTNGATNQTTNTNITITFSEAVNVTGNWFQIVCGAQTKNPGDTVVTGGPITFTINPTTDFAAGNICQVTVFAAQVTDQDSGDPPDNMAANYVFSFSVPPVAVNDTYSPTIVGNVGVNTDNSTEFSVLTNDTPTSGVTINQSGSSTQGGTVVVAADGKFMYTPPAGYEGADSFNYTISTPAGTSNTAVVSLTVTGMIWFINNGAASCVVAGCGRLSNPFSTLAAFNTLNNGTGNNPAAGDNIFIYENASSYTGPITLLSNQKLIGQDATASLATIAGVSVPADSFPLPVMNTGAPATTLDVSSAGINVVNLNAVGTSNTVRGMTLTTSSTTTKGINGLTFGTLNTADLIISGSGPALDLSTGTLSATINSLSSNGSGADGVRLDNLAGTLTANAGSIQNATGQDVDISGNNVGDTLDFTYAGSITDDVGTLVSVANQNGGTKLFSGTITDGNDGDGSGISLTSNTGATITFSGTVTLSTGTNPAFTATGGGTVNSTATDGTVSYIKVTNVGSGYTSAPTVSFTGGGGSGAAATAVVFNGKVVAVNITSPGSGYTSAPAISFGGPGSGASSTSLLGGLSTITTTTGTALNVTSTTIGSGGLLFRGITANGPANAIVLNSTGASGGLSVTGDGAASNNGSGGTIQNTTGVGISLTTTQNVHLGHINLLTSGDDGIRGQGVTNFTLDRCNLTNNGNATAENGIQFGEATGSVAGLFGTAAITNTAVSGSAGNNLHLRNVASTLDSFVVTASSFNNLVDATGANSFLFEITDNATLTTGMLTSCTFQNNTPQRALEVQVHNNGTITKFTVQNSTFIDNGIQASFTQDANAAGNTGNMDFNFLNNGTASVPMTGCVLQAVNVFSSSNTVGGFIKGRIEGNFIGNPAVAGSGSNGGGGIRILIQGKTQGTFNIDGNTIRQVGFTSGARGMDLQFLGPLTAAQPPTQSDITITNNFVQTDAPLATFPLAAIFLSADNQGSPALVRADIRTNTVPVTGTFDYPTFSGVDAQLIYEELSGATAQLVDNAPASANATAELQSHNTGTMYASAGVALIAGPITLPPVALFRQNRSKQLDLLAQNNQTTHPESRTQSTAAATSVASSDALPTPGATAVKSVAQRSAQALRRHVTPFELATITSAGITAHAQSRAPEQTKRSEALGRNRRQTSDKLSFVASRQPSAQTVASKLGPASDRAKVVEPRSAAKQTFSHHALPKARPSSLKSATPARAATTTAPVLNPTCGSGTIAICLGTLKAGKTVNIQFKVTVNTPFPATDASNQGSVGFDGGGPVLTDDPSVGGANDPTVTPVVAQLALIVNTLGDAADNTVGDGICDSDVAAGSQCTLRAAIQESNFAATADTIGFSLPALSTITLASALPAITGDLVINGPATGLIVNGNNNSRVFSVTSGTVDINTLTVSSGRVVNGNGGGLLVSGGNVTVTDMLFTGNTVINGSGGGLAVTGGTLDVLNTTVSGNTATNGGGIYNGGGGLTLVNVTVTNNNANGDVGAGPGGATGDGGGIHVASNPTNVRNTIIAGNTAFTTNPNVSGTINLLGNNITSGDPRLAPLADNGGPTQTHALLAGSPALDAGDNAQATGAGLTNDQRGAGFARITDGPDGDATATVDIGAFEAQVWVEDIADRSINEDGSDSFSFGVGGSAAITTVTATSSNTALVPNNTANLEVTGSGSTRTLTINPVLNQFGATTITVTVNSASGSMSDTFVFTVVSVNDTPSFTKGPDQAVNEDAGAQTVTGWATNISPGPANESTQTLTFLVNTSNNPLFAVLPAVSAGGTLTYTPAANASGVATVFIALQDSGDDSNDVSPTQQFTITVNAVNDAPVNTVPGTQNVNENSSLTFSAGNSNLISIADIDAGSSSVRVTLTASNGTFSLSGIAGLSFTVGDGTADGAMTFTGAIANINAALNGLVFTPTAGFSGGASLQIVTNDQGNTGSGGPLSDSDTINITVQDGGTLQFSAATYNVSENGGPATITITRTGGSAGTATVLFQTSNGTAGAGDYTTVSQTVTFVDGDTTETVNVPITNDSASEPNETVNLTLSNAGGTGALGAQSTAVLTITNDDTPSFQLDASSYNINENGEHLTITVSRAGDPSQAISVDYATSDLSGLNECSQITNHASQRCDYATVVGTLRFAAGQTSRVIHISIVDDVYIEGVETFTLTLSNNSGGDLGTPVSATITINDNDVGPAANPIDNDAFWIRQMYIDILGREPEPGAVNAWLAILNNCTVATDCDRAAVALGFLQSEEFQSRGFFIYRFYAASLGRAPLYSEFVPDHARMSGFLSPAELELNKEAYLEEFMSRTEFKNIYDPTLNSSTVYVDTLLARAGLPNHPRRGDWINGLTNTLITRAQVLRELIDSVEVKGKFVNEAFVVMNYFGLLRRSADAQYLVWINILNTTGSHRTIVSGFINSQEYRLRFGPN